MSNISVGKISSRKYRHLEYLNGIFSNFNDLKQVYICELCAFDKNRFTLAGGYWRVGIRWWAFDGGYWVVGIRWWALNGGHWMVGI